MSETRALAIIPRTIDECVSLAERCSKSETLPKELRGKVPETLMTIMAGQELGLAPMTSLRVIHIIDAKPVISADGMVAIVLGSGKAVYFERVDESDTAVTYETLRVGAAKPRRCTWTMTMAKTAALHLKDNWRGYPRAMLASRAKAELARDVFPDVLAGCYTPEEVESFSVGPRPAYVEAVKRSDPAQNDDIQDAEIVTVADQCSAAADMAALKALVKPLNALPKGSPERVAGMAAFKARSAELELAAQLQASVEAVAQ